MDLLQRAVGVLDERGYATSNLDVVVITESPKIGPVSPAMSARIGEVLGIAPEDVSVKGKTNEGMGWIGSREGLAVHAVALVVKKTS